jgi:hypothetical protein
VVVEELTVENLNNIVVVVEKMNLNKTMEYSGIEKMNEMMEYFVVDNLNELEAAFVVVDVDLNGMVAVQNDADEKMEEAFVVAADLNMIVMDVVVHDKIVLEVLKMMDVKIVVDQVLH